MGLRCLLLGHDPVERDEVKDPAGAIVRPVHCSWCHKRLDLEIVGSWYPNPDMEVGSR